MSMRSYPMIEKNRLFIDHALVACLNIDADKQDNNIDPDVQAILDDIGLAKALKDKALPLSCYDNITAVEICQNRFPETIYCTSFDGTVTTVREFDANEDVIDLNMDDEFLIYIQFPGDTPADVAAAAKAAMGDIVPDDFDFEARICDIYGTYFC